ncbi:SRPBCC domain-containing protein [Actinoallomurus soli]|uniref:SRPBCC domain-containing protein n=1 Tax=Actinoallomurus soli TaxID=2952535 RepID=UPI0020937EE3|nr:SRPBCC domain-containing protein [Actinoallomurus soli]MCO5974939.1 SRPBCC domain-containing protein [Actinoallomurus soli]
MNDQDTAPGQPADGLDVRHDTFTISRRLDAPRPMVFAAFADTAVRRRWFELPGSGAAYHHEFGVGGGETAQSTFTIMDAPPKHLDYRSRYLDIVPNRRIVYVYESTVNDVLRWTSPVTVLLADEAGSTHLTWAEQVTFLIRTGDGSADPPHLRGGTALRTNGLRRTDRS